MSLHPKGWKASQGEALMSDSHVAEAMRRQSRFVLRTKTGGCDISGWIDHQWMIADDGSTGSSPDRAVYISQCDAPELRVSVVLRVTAVVGE